jgi:hypothetical protein
MPKPRRPGFTALLLTLALLGLPAAVGAQALLVDNGGRVLATPRISAIYFGVHWTTATGVAEAQRNDTFLATWVGGPSVTDVLRQYRVASASFVGSETVPAVAPPLFTDEDAQNLVKEEIAAGRVPSGPETVQVIYLPPGTILSFEGQSSTAGLAGYHSSYLDPFTLQQVYYAVIVYNDGTNGFAVTNDPQKNLSIFGSRALAGAFTNPDVDGGRAGWLDPRNGEVGDIAFALSTDPTFADVFTTENGFAVVRLWSNRDNALSGTTSSAGPGGAAGATGGTATSLGGTLTITPATREAVPGTSVTLTIANLATATSPVTLSVTGLSETVSGTFAATSLVPGASTTLTVTVAADATPGTSVTLTVVGITAAGAAQTVDATISVVTTLTAAAPQATPADFSFTVTPAAQDVPRGEVARFVVLTEAVSETASPRLKVKVVGLQNRLKAYVSRSKITAGDTVTITIMAHRSARSREYAFAIKVSSDQGDQFVPVSFVLR